MKNPMDDLMLPPLPEPYQIWETWGQNVDVFNADQMREYAKQAVEAEREAIREALTLLGPKAPECSGCAYEWQEAINVLQAALD